jgi:ABC-type transporter MlaC component
MYAIRRAGWKAILLAALLAAPTFAAKPTPAKQETDASLTKAQIKARAKRLKAERKAQQKQQADEEQAKMIDYCVRLSRKPMAQVTDSDLSALGRCRYLGFL